MQHLDATFDEVDQIWFNFSLIKLESNLDKVTMRL